MKKLCRNCGAKVPKKSDICKKCGEPYEYIDLIRLDPEAEKALQIDKPSVMNNVCILILSILVFAYSLFLIYQTITDKSKASDDFSADSSVSDSVSEESQTEDTDMISDVHYNASDFIGLPFSEVKKTLGEKYIIKVSDSTLIEHKDYSITLSTTDKSLTDDSVISKVILSGNAQITPVVRANMTFNDLKTVLALTQNAPELNEQDAFYYVCTAFETDVLQVQADFKFDDDSTDKAPIEVTLYSQALITPKIMGTVTGLDDFLNMRTEPLYAADEVHQLYNGDQVEILEEVTSDDGALWYKVLYNDSIMGYSSAEFIVKNSEIKNNDPSEDSSEADESGETESTDETESEE